jgi:very-short-patch-repair endonuclease
MARVSSDDHADFGELCAAQSGVLTLGLPEPDRQVERQDGQGRRWLDAVWEHTRLVVEIDGRWHMEIRAWWEDMQRDNELTVDGYGVLRFPAFVVRDTPELVAMLIARALNRAGG